MNRRLTGLAIAGVFVAVGVVAASPPSQSLEEVIAKNLDAKGGAAKLKALQTLKQTGTLSMQGMEATIVTYTKRPNKLRQEVNIGGQLVINVFDGESAWIINPIVTPPGQKPQPIVVSGPQADMIREQSNFDPPLLDYRAQGYGVVLDGVETMDGRKVTHLRLVSKGGQVSHLYLDAATGLDVKLTSTLNNTKLEQEFLDFRDVDGAKFPFVVRQRINGVVQSEIRVKTIELDAKIDDALFRLPR